MKEKEIKTLIKVYDYEELSAEDRELVDAAKAMTRSSYAPYSRFHVGAAIRMDGGEIVTGSNPENAAYPSGDMCGAHGCLLGIRTVSGCGDEEDCGLPPDTPS